jgi:hypothetical protein
MWLVPPLRMLGLDPGLRRTGYAAAEVERTTRTITPLVCPGTIEPERQMLKTVRMTSDDLHRAQFQASSLRSGNFAFKRREVQRFRACVKSGCTDRW